MTGAGSAGEDTAPMRAETGVCGEGLEFGGRPARRARPEGLGEHFIQTCFKTCASEAKESGRYTLSKAEALKFSSRTVTSFLPHQGQDGNEAGLKVAVEGQS